MVALLLGALSVVTVLAVSMTAAVVQTGDDADPGGSGTLVRGGAGDGRVDYTGWSTVTGTPGASGDPATYRAPEGWETRSADDPVEYLTHDGGMLARGHSSSYYWGNDCRQRKGGARVPGGWAALADTTARSDSGDLSADALVAHAEVQLRDWGRGYGTNAQGVTGPMTAHPGEAVELDDGTVAGRARMEIDMSDFPGRCLPDTAEIMITSIDTEDGTKSLVQARYLLDDGAVSDEAWDGIAASLTP